MPYQTVATPAQFARAHPNSTKLLEVTRRADRTGKFTNAFWDLYQPTDEYGLKGIDEGTLGRLRESYMPKAGTAEDRYAAKVARDYATLISTRGRYEFSYTAALRGLWQLPASGPGLIRKWERRFALSDEYTIKSVHASIIGAGRSAGHTCDVQTRYAVVAGWNDSLSAGATAGETAGATVGDTMLSRFKTVLPLDRGYSLVSVDRYDPYRHALLALSDHADRVRLAEISDSEIVSVSGTAPSRGVCRRELQRLLRSRCRMIQRVCRCCSKCARVMCVMCVMCSTECEVRTRFGSRISMTTEQAVIQEGQSIHGNEIIEPALRTVN